MWLLDAPKVLGVLGVGGGGAYTPPSTYNLSAEMGVRQASLSALAWPEGTPHNISRRHIVDMMDTRKTPERP